MYICRLYTKPHFTLKFTFGLNHLFVSKHLISSQCTCALYEGRRGDEGRGSGTVITLNGVTTIHLLLVHADVRIVLCFNFSAWVYIWAWLGIPVWNATVHGI